MHIIICVYRCIHVCHLPSVSKFHNRTHLFDMACPCTCMCVDVHVHICQKSLDMCRKSSVLSYYVSCMQPTQHRFSFHLFHSILYLVSCAFAVMNSLLEVKYVVEMCVDKMVVKTTSSQTAYIILFM